MWSGRTGMVRGRIRILTKRCCVRDPQLFKIMVKPLNCAKLRRRAGMWGDRRRNCKLLAHPSLIFPHVDSGPYPTTFPNSLFKHPLCEDKIASGVLGLGTTARLCFAQSSFGDAAVIVGVGLAQSSCRREVLGEGRGAQIFGSDMLLY